MAYYRNPKTPASVWREKTPSSAGQILSSALKRIGLDKDINRYRFVQFWEEIVGEQIAQRAFPEVIRDGTLYVKVTSSAWAQELTFQKSVILSRVKRFCDNPHDLRDVRFVTGKN